MRQIRLKKTGTDKPIAADSALRYGWVPDTSLNRLSLETILYLGNRGGSRPSYLLEERDLIDRHRDAGTKEARRSGPR
jgi:hypothetical protein